MRMTFVRSRPAVEPAPVRRTVTTRTLDTRTDLICSACSHVIAYGVRPDRVLADAGFFLDAHKPFCGGMRTAG
jgi:hypothetical protein